MAIKLWRRLTLSSLVAVVMAQTLPLSLSLAMPIAIPQAALAKAEIFSDMSVDQAKEQAQNSGSRGCSYCAGGNYEEPFVGVPLKAGAQNWTLLTTTCQAHRFCPSAA